MRFLVSLPEMPLSRLSSPLPRWAIKRCPQGGWHRWRSARPTLWARHREDEVRNGNPQRTSYLVSESSSAKGSTQRFHWLWVHTGSTILSSLTHACTHVHTHYAQANSAEGAPNNRVLYKFPNNSQYSYSHGNRKPKGLCLTVRTGT